MLAPLIAVALIHCPLAVQVVAMLPREADRAEEIGRAIQMFQDANRCALEIELEQEAAASGIAERIRAMRRAAPKFILGPVDGDAAAALGEALGQPGDPVILSLAPVSKGKRTAHANSFRLGVDEAAMRDRALAIARRNARIRSVVLITAADPRPPSLGWDVFVPDLKVDSRVAPGPDAALRLDPIDRKTALVAESRPWIVASVPASYGEALRLFFGRAGVGAFPKRSGAFDAVAPPCAQSVKGKLFAKSYKARYEKEPNLGYAYQTYAALQVMADTAKAFPPRLHDAATFADFIRMSPFRTILGEIRFWKGDATWRSDSLWHVDYGDVRSEPKCVDDPATLLDLLPRLGGG